MRWPVAVALMAVVGIGGSGWAQDRPAPAVKEVPFHRGVNLTSWLQAGGPRQIQFTKFTKQDLENIKSLGCDVIRLPMDLHAMTDGAPNYTVDPRFFSLLDQIVDWCEELELHLIFDNCAFGDAADTKSNDDQIRGTIPGAWARPSTATSSAGMANGTWCGSP